MDNNIESVENLCKGDFVMHFDPEYDVWFKCKVLKATENFYVLSTVEWDKNDLKPCVRRDSDQLESEDDVGVKWKQSKEIHAGFIRVKPPNIPPSVAETRRFIKQMKSQMAEDENSGALQA